MASEEESIENAAILLMSLGEEEAAQVFKHLGPKEVQKLESRRGVRRSPRRARGRVGPRR